MRVKNKLLYFIPVVLVYVAGMFVDVLEVDEAQYAELSREMLQTSQYLELYNNGRDYLDKPPLLFWIATLSYRLFGISTFAYKLPSVLFSILGLFSTYRLGRRLYNEQTGFFASLILSTSLAWFIMNHDVRTDTILAACTILAIWQFCEFLNSNKFIHIFWGSLGIAGAMMTKGPIGIMVPGLAIGIHLLFRKDWKSIFMWQWLAVPGIVTVCLLPMLYGLYQQFDLHPGKIIDGMTIESGLKFFFWTQSFGRITGESIWKDDSTFLFFTHTFLWAFIPWGIIGVISIGSKTVGLARSGFKVSKNQELITWGGFVFPFIAFSCSNYKLPHYIYVLFPLISIISGSYLENNLNLIKNKIYSYLINFQIFTLILIFLLVFFLNFICFPVTNYLLWLVFAIGFGSTMWSGFVSKDLIYRFILPTYFCSVSINFLLNLNFFPKISEYSSGNKASLFVSKSSNPKNYAIFKETGSYGTDFYSNRHIVEYNDILKLENDWKDKVLWVFTGDSGYKELLKSGFKIYETRKFEDFHISMLSIQFIWPDTRHKEVTNRYLLKIKFNSRN